MADFVYDRGAFKPTIGDRVRIRQWEDMKEEFGTVGEDINCRFRFTQGMKFLCGLEFEVERVTLMPTVGISEMVFSFTLKVLDSYASEDERMRAEDIRAHYISIDMLEPAYNTRDDLDAEYEIENEFDVFLNRKS